MGLTSLAVAQTVAVPASDPVGIARAGAGVAFGRSLEAAGLNPALLPTLGDRVAVYISAGEELQSSQVSLQSNQLTYATSDRNRFLPAFGAAWKLKPNFFLGLKLDEPFLRHGSLDSSAPGRFQGRSLDLGTHRLEAQGGWSPQAHPEFSFGLGLGMTRVSYEGSAALRAPVPTDATQPLNPTSNPSLGLLEESISQRGNSTRPSFTLGTRWALNPRWTLGAVYQSEVKGDLSLQASQGVGVGYTGNDGFGTPSSGIATQGPVLQSSSQASGGNGHFRLPPRAAFGVRQRVNQLFTWEFDARATGTLILPAWGTMETPSGPVRPGGNLGSLKRTYGFSLAGEFTLSKTFVLRGGMAIDSAARDANATQTLTSGARSAGFSIGMGYQIWGGEFNFGYQYRQAQDVLTAGLDQSWSLSGPHQTGTPARVEGMGHIFAVGFRTSFR